MEDATDPARIMTYSVAFLERTGGASLTPLELRGEAGLADRRNLVRSTGPAGGTGARDRGIRFGCDLHMTADAGMFQPAGVGDLILHEGKTFHQYTDGGTHAPRYSVRLDCS